MKENGHCIKACHQKSFMYISSLKKKKRKLQHKNILKYLEARKQRFLHWDRQLLYVLQGSVIKFLWFYGWSFQPSSFQGKTFLFVEFFKAFDITLSLMKEKKPYLLFVFFPHLHKAIFSQNQYQSMVSPLEATKWRHPSSSTLHSWV